MSLKNLRDESGWDRGELLGLIQFVQSLPTPNKPIIVLAIHRICGNNDKFASRDELTVSSVCRKLIRSLADLPSESLKENEWISLIQTLTKGFALPLPDTVQECKKSEDSDVNVVVQIVESRRIPQDSGLSHLFKLNAAYIAGGDLLERICKRLFPKDVTEVGSANTLSFRVEEAQEKVLLVKNLLSCPWNGLSQKTMKIIRSVGTSILISAANICSPTEANQGNEQLMSDSIHVHLIAIQATIFTLDDSLEYSRYTTNIYCQIFDKFIDGYLMIIVARGLLDMLPVLPTSNVKSLTKSLWRMAAQSCSQTTPIPSQMHSADVPRMVPQIATPESDDLDLNQWINTAMLQASGINCSSQVNESNAEIISVIARSLDALTSLEEPFADTENDLLTVAMHAAKLEDQQLIVQFGQLYRHLLAKKVINETIQDSLLTALLEDFESGKSICVCEVLSVIVQAQAALKETSAARSIVAKTIAIASGETALDLHSLELMRDMVPLLSPANIEELLKQLVPIVWDSVKKYLTREGIAKDAIVIQTRLHLLHILLKNARDLVPLDHFYRYVNEKKKNERKTSQPIKHGVENTKWQLQLAMTGLSEQEYCQFLFDVSLATLSDDGQKRVFPSGALPPINSLFLKSISDDSATLAAMTFFFRSYNNLFNEATRNYLKFFNSADPTFETLLLETLSRDKACPIAIRFIKRVRKQLEEGSAVSMMLPVLDAIFVLLSSPLTFTPELCDEFVSFVDYLEKRALIVECTEHWSSPGAVDRVQSVLQLLRNPLLKEIAPDAEQILSDAVSTEVIQFANSFVRPLFAMTTGPNEAPLPDMDWQSRLRDESPQTVESVAVRLLHDQLTRDLHTRVAIPESQSDRTIEWLYKSHALQTLAATVNANEVAKKVFTGSESNLQAARLTALVVELLHGIADTRSRFPIEKGHLPEVFSELLHRVFECRDLPWKEVPATVAKNVFELFGEQTFALSVPLLTLIDRILKSESVPEEARDLLLHPLEASLVQFPSWISAVPSPLSVFNASTTLLKHLAKKAQIRTILHQVIANCIPFILKESLLDELQKYFPIEIQKSDRFGQSMLKWRFKKDNEIEENLDTDDDPIGNALSLITEFATPNLHAQITSRLAELLDIWLTFTKDEQEVLEGNKSLPEEDNRLVWRVLILTNLFTYLDELASRLNGHSDDSQYYSDDEPLKEQLNKTLFSLGQSGRAKAEALREERNASSEPQHPLCTYASTDKEFVYQHWYNCHTCGMTDSVGVCSICAINCHRGHDISYSKHGSFFCDCGAKGKDLCRSLSNAPNDYSSTLKVIQGYIGEKSLRNGEFGQNSTLPPLEHPFENIEVEPGEEDDIRKALNKVKEMLDKHADDIHRFFKASKEASNSRWNLDCRRAEAAAYENKIVAHEELVISTGIERLEVFERRGDTPAASQTPNAMARELLDVVRLSTGRSVIVWLSESGNLLTLIHPSPTGKFGFDQSADPITDWRVDTELLSFVGKKVDCSGDRCVVVGLIDCLLLRFGKDAEIIERQTFRPPEPTPGPSSNPLLKAVWGNGDRPFLALAGTQHIKIFNVLHDLDQCVEELVLPVGNVVDILVDTTDAGGPKVAVLSSQGHLYIHQMQDRDLDDQLEAGSYFLTNNVNLPQVSTAISMHYSKATQLLFVSNTSATFYAHVPNGDLGKLATEHFKKLQVADPLHCWHESDGLLSAVHHAKPTLATFIYPTMKTLLTQQIELDKPALTHVLWTNPTANGHFSVFLLNDPIKRCAVFTSNWNHERDLWIADFPREIRSVDENEEKREESVEETPQEDLVTIFEFSTPITRVSFACDALKQYYDPDDLTKRLSTVGSMPITILQKEDIEIEIRVQEWNVVVRGIRVEVSPTRCPAAVTFLDEFYPLQGDGTRSYDIKLTRQQSLALEKSFLLKFHHSTNSSGQTAITSIQLFGVTRGEFDWPSPTRCLTSPLTLPHRFLTRLIDLYTNTIGAGIEYKAFELPVHLGAGACAPRAAHSQLCVSASTLLRTAVSLNDYYNYRDRAIFNDFREFHFLGVHGIPIDILPVYINHVKLMLSTRVILYEKIVKEMFDDTLNFCQFLAEQLSMISGDPTGLIELYVLVVFHALSTGNSQKNEIEERYLEIFTNQKTSKHSSKLRIISQRLIQTFVGVSRADRNLAKGFGANRRVLKDGGALPFYTVSKLIDEDGDYKEIEKRMGKTISANELGTDDRDLFEENKECAWVLSLLKKTIEKIAGKTVEREENDDEEMEGTRRIERLRPDSPQANALIAMSIVMLAQLSSKLVLNVAESLVKMIDFKNHNLLEGKSENFRQLLLLRIISVLLQKWEEMNDRKARSPLKFSKEISHPSEENESEDGEATRDATPTREKTPKAENDTSKSEKKKELSQLCLLLIGSGCVDLCLQTLQQAEIYWKSWQEADRVLKRWMRDHEKGNAELLNQYPRHWPFNDGYHLMVTDCALRLPYLLHKNLGITFADEWNEVLCQLMLSCSVVTVRRLTRKLLIAINENDKNKYRLVKSRHVISGQIAELKEKLNAANGAALTHSQLTQMVEAVLEINGDLQIVNKMSEAATERPQVWREIACDKLSWLLSIACQLPDAVSGSVVDLLVTAIRALPQEEQVASTDCLLERENHDLIECQLADQLISQFENLLLFKRLLVRYLLGKDEQKRWMLHGMVRSTIQLASRNNQVTLVKILCSDLWPLGRSLGTLGAQLGDLLSTYTPRLLPHADLTTIMEQEVNAIEKAQKRLHDCGHDSSSRQMNGLGLGWREAMLIDTSPCLVCTSRQDATQTMKMSMIKQDSRYTTNSHLIKLAGHYEISRVIVKLSEVKRSKTIKKAVLYYCQKVVETAIDLKNNKDQWEQAAETTVSPGDTEISLTLPIPLSTSSLIVQFSELNEARTGGELHCPRCSALVQANPGVCENCGENVYQCVKCRQINYDEKEPFLCPSCGFCKYARMELLVVCRPLASVPPITSDQEYLQAQEAVGKLLTEMEQTRTSLTAAKALAEALWIKTRPLPPISLHEESVEHANILMQAVPQLNPTQSSVSALSLCVAHCKAVHEELCAQTAQLIAFREELRAFENSSTNPMIHRALNLGFYSTSTNCLGCTCSSIVHSISLISATCDDSGVFEKVLENEFIWSDLPKLGKDFEPLQDEVELMLCRLTFDNEKGTQRLCSLVLDGKISGCVLARSLLAFPDNHWQIKLRTLVKLVTKGRFDENLSLALLTVIEKYVSDGKTIKRRAQRANEQRKVMKRRLIEEQEHPEKVRRSRSSLPESFFTHDEHDEYDEREFEIPLGRKIHIHNRKLIDLPTADEWLNSNDSWAKLRQEKPKTKTRKEKDEIVDEILKGDCSLWFWSAVFSPFLSLRAASTRLITTLSSMPGQSGTAVALIIAGLIRSTALPPSVLDQFFRIAHGIVGRSAVRIRLYAANFHLHLAKMIKEECLHIHGEELRETTMDHWFGTRLRFLVELLCSMMGGSTLESLLIRASRYHLLAPVFQSTIFLRRVVLKRTRAIDASRIALERLLKRLSTKDPEALLKVAVSSLEKTDDFYTQAQIVSSIVEVIDPVKKEDDDFLIQIEKDPAQEEYLQGRMTGNPYKSGDSGLGPLMRDIKNKICRDTELLTLLEDENAIELLVGNQIIALNLSVKAVYEKMWKRSHPNQPMMVIYRLRGLLGDATEQFVSTLVDNDENEQVDSSASPIVTALSECGGVTKALSLLTTTSLSASGRLLFTQLKRLFDVCLRTEPGRRTMVEAGAVEKFLSVFIVGLRENGLDVEKIQDACDPDAGPSTRQPLDFSKISVRSESSQIAESYLGILETLLKDKKMHPLLRGVPSTMISSLLSLLLYQPILALEPTRRTLTAAIVQCPLTMTMRGSLSRVLPHACIGRTEAIEKLVDSIHNTFDWEMVDARCGRNSLLIESNLAVLVVMCQLVADILPSKEAAQIKDRLLEKGLLSTAVDYLLREHPPLFNTMESPEWKEYLGRSCLKTVLTLMGGMAKGHEKSQKAIAEKSLHMLHRLEQVASVESLGTLAETVVDALKENTEVAAQIEAVRLETKQKKRQMAMQMRQKQLSKMGMQLGTSGEVKVSSRKIANEPTLEESGPSDPLQSCCICRESITQGPRIPCVYAYASLADSRPGQPPEYTTVSQMILVHGECHTNAIRRTTGRGSQDEWSKASLHNAGGLCNVLMPVAVGDSSSPHWNAALFRAVNDISQVSPSAFAITRASAFSDLCQLVDRFINQRSFSQLSKGGGRESNMQYLLVLHLLALSQEEKAGDLPARTPERRLLTYLLTTQTAQHWDEEREDALRAAMNDACGEDGLRAALSNSATEADWHPVKGVCLTWALVDRLFKKVIPIDDEDRLQWLKDHFIEGLRKMAQLVISFDEDVLPCVNFAEFADVMEIDPSEDVWLNGVVL